MELELTLIALIFFGGILLHLLYRISPKPTFVESFCTLKYLFSIITLGFFVGNQSQGSYQILFTIVLIYFHSFLALIWIATLNLSFCCKQQNATGA